MSMKRSLFQRLSLVGVTAGLLLASVLPGTANARATARDNGRFLPNSKFTMRSIRQIDLRNDAVRFPLHRGNFNGVPVWFVLTDASDAGTARSMGLNFAPKLAHAGDGCPACLQHVSGRFPNSVNFVGVPDFSPTRLILPGLPTGFPPAGFQPGAIGGPGYSPFIQLPGSAVVFDAPIVAVGRGPFDVVHHTNTGDRVLAMDTRAMTVDELIVRGFADGKPILYASFESSDPLVATIERATFVPALQDLSFPNGGNDPRSARASIFSFVNGQVGLKNRARAQGQMHVLLDGANDEDASLQNRNVINRLFLGGDVHNVFQAFPTLRDPAQAQVYSPAWDLQLGVWSTFAVAHKLNFQRRDAGVIRQLALRGLVTGPHALAPLNSANVVINCPALAFSHDEPLAPQAPNPLGH
jgi:hypothetical protein